METLLLKCSKHDRVSAALEDLVLSEEIEDVCAVLKVNVMNERGEGGVSHFAEKPADDFPDLGEVRQRRVSLRFGQVFRENFVLQEQREMMQLNDVVYASIPTSNIELTDEL
ncbi:hypothetical protein AB0D05_09055 [Micrococcus luteus]|uniref:hypothetical protein n=1 Tax=Micrococcus luteus TaxID=1270 RepID=UPI0033D8D323